MSALLEIFHLVTCNAVPPPRWLRALAGLNVGTLGTSPSEWEMMCAALRRAGQEHILTPECPPEKREAFLAQLREIDLDRLPHLLQSSLANAQSAEGQTLEPFPHVTSLDDLEDSEVRSLRGRGLDMIARGEVAALLLAGGQGTRLGTTAPKGMYNIGLPSGKSLYQYHAERVIRVKQLAAAHAGIPESRVRLPLVIMTSDATRELTENYFKDNKYFGLPPSQLVFFEQGERLSPSVSPSLAPHPRAGEVVTPHGAPAAHATSGIRHTRHTRHVHPSRPRPTLTRQALPRHAPITLTLSSGMNPCLTKDAKLMLSSPGELSMAPNGNGGCYLALHRSGTLDQLTQQGVRGIFQFGVDNMLCHVADPTFIGFCASQEAECASKTVR
jgi:UDP-N-acetylglucosamine pyrophosphorylase